MRIHYLFFLKTQADYSRAEEEIRSLQGEDLYTIEDLEHGIQIGCWITDDTPPPSGLYYEKVESAPDEINWESQWEQFSHGYQEGLCHINFQDFNGPDCAITLKPGSGFGDLSHPTTRLMLKSLVQMELENSSVLDIGSGSGILSIAAKALGAKEVIGLEIDQEAILHANENATLNELNILFTQKAPLIKLPLVVLMNMTLQEQVIAYEEYKNSIPKPFIILTSGILKEQKEVYLEIVTKEFGWEIFAIDEEEGWISVICHCQQ